MVSAKILGLALLSVLSLAAPLHEEDGLAIGLNERSAEPMSLETRLDTLEKRLASMDMGADLYARSAFAEMGHVSTYISHYVPCTDY
jgi:hypothetical protein